MTNTQSIGVTQQALVVHYKCLPNCYEYVITHSVYMYIYEEYIQHGSLYAHTRRYTPQAANLSGFPTFINPIFSDGISF